MSKQHVYYEDIPQKERRKLASQVGKKPSIIILSLVGFVVALAVANTVTESWFPDDSQRVQYFLWGNLFMLLLYLFFLVGIIQPRIKREVERIKNYERKNED